MYLNSYVIEYNLWSYIRGLKWTVSLNFGRRFANMFAFLAKIFDLYATINYKYYNYCYGYGPSGFYGSTGSLPVFHRFNQALCCRFGIHIEFDKQNGVEKTKSII